MRALLIIVIASVTLAAQTAAPQVTSQDLLDGLKDPTKWLTYGGNYSGHRHSPLTQITPENVNQLSAQWTFQTGTLGSFQTTPSSWTACSTSPASTTTRGRSTRAPDQIWRYRRDLPEDLRLCGTVNRGFAALGDRRS
jgi:alcohol dehydrogenase (cytochrome c)